jgi:L-rhamnose-H+ transport protein
MVNELLWFGLCGIAGLLNASFAVPIKLNSGWEWENSWVLYILMGMVLMPAFMALMMIPNLLQIYHNVTAGVLTRTFLFGLGYGLGAITFGLGLKKAGIALGTSLVVSILAVTGALVPLLVYNPSSLLTREGGMIGLAMCLTVVGVVLCGKAAMLRSDGSSTPSVFSAEMKKGLLLCIISGILSAFLNFSFSFGSAIADEVRSVMGTTVSPVVANSAVWAIGLLGGSVANLLYFGFLLKKNRTWRNYIIMKPLINWLRALLAGVIWFSALVLYGIAAFGLGQMGTVVGWLVISTASVVGANILGLILGEWAGSPRLSLHLMGIGVLCLICSVVLVGLRNF